MTTGGPQFNQPPAGDPSRGWDAYPPGQAPVGYPYPQPAAGYPYPPPYPQSTGYPGYGVGAPGYGPPVGPPPLGPPPIGAPGYGLVRPPHYVRRGVRGLGFALVLAGAAGVVGSIAPWAWVRVPTSSVRFENDYTATGLDGGGVFTLAMSAAVAIMGIILIKRTMLGLSITALCCGALSALVGLGNLASINSAADEIRILYSADAGPSWGLWLVIASGAVAALGALIALIRGRWIDPAPATAYLGAPPTGW